MALSAGNNAVLAQMMRAMPVAGDWQRVAAGISLTVAGSKSLYAYFPDGCVLSLQHALADGFSAEVAMVGAEAVLDATSVLGADSCLYTAQVLVAGQVYRTPLASLQQQLQQSPAMQAIVCRHLQELLAQAGRTALCNRHHHIEQQVARWLLQLLQHTDQPVLAVTHDVMARSLGVRREGVTDAAGKLQNLGCIRYSRGSLEIVDADRLASHACACGRPLLPPTATARHREGRR